MSQSIRLQVAAPFSLRATALSHGWHECSPISWSEGGRCLQVVEREGDRAYCIWVVETKRPKSKVTLRVTVEGDGLDEAVLARARDRIAIMLNLEADLSEFYAICRKHPTLYVIPRIGAGRLLRSASMTENIIKTLCATNVNWTQAVKMINRLGQLGPPVRHFRHLTAWPTVGEILRAGEDYLKGVCRLGYRAEGLLAFCREVHTKRFKPDGLLDPADSDEGAELLTKLQSIRGIGPSSAHFLLSLLGHYDRLSIDSATLAHVARTHRNGRRTTPREVERIYEDFGPWKNLVYWFENWLTWDTAKKIGREAVAAD